MVEVFVLTSLYIYFQQVFAGSPTVYNTAHGSYKNEEYCVVSNYNAHIVNLELVQKDCVSKKHQSRIMIITLLSRWKVLKL